MFTIRLVPPPGVAFTQWPDGSIQLTYSTDHVMPLRKMLIDNVKLLKDQAIAHLEKERQAEIDKQRMPLTRLERISKEMNQLKANTVDDDFDLTDIRAEIEAMITVATSEDDEGLQH